MPSTLSQLRHRWTQENKSKISKTLRCRSPRAERKHQEMLGNDLARNLERLTRDRVASTQPKAARRLWARSEAAFVDRLEKLNPPTSGAKQEGQPTDSLQIHETLVE